jgi:hypothetical protein
VHDNMSNAKTFTKTAKVVNKDATTIYVAHLVMQIEQSYHARRCHNNLSRYVTHIRSRTAAMMKQHSNQQNII